MTPPITEAEVAAIAKGLTKAQREALPLLPESSRPVLPIDVSRVTRDRLVEKLLLYKQAPASGFVMVRWWLTPLGLAVRAYLERRR